MATTASAREGVPDTAAPQSAVLLRCRAARPTWLDEPVESLVQWRDHPLSTSRISDGGER